MTQHNKHDTHWQAYSRLKLATRHFGRVPASLTADELHQLDSLLLQQLKLEDRILSYADQSGIRIPTQSLTDALVEVRSAYADEAAWLAAMAAIDLDCDGLKKALLRELTVNAVMEKVSENLVPMTIADARRWYAEHEIQFVRPERRLAAHILLTVQDDQADSDIEKTYAQIQKIRAQVVTAPATFGALALRYSECPTALQEGRIGLVREGQLYPELDEVLFHLPLELISPVVRSSMGFHILRCERIEAASVLPVEDAIPKIIETQLSQARTKLQKRWLAWLVQQDAS